MDFKKRQKRRFIPRGGCGSLKMVVDEERFYRKIAPPNTLIVEFFRRINEENVRLLMNNVRRPETLKMGRYVKIQFDTPEDCREAEELIKKFKFKEGEARISHPVLIRERKRKVFNPEKQQGKDQPKKKRNVGGSHVKDSDNNNKNDDNNDDNDDDDDDDDDDDVNMDSSEDEDDEDNSEDDEDEDEDEDE